jgi:hypothetical protein
VVNGSAAEVGSAAFAGGGGGSVLAPEAGGPDCTTEAEADGLPETGAPETGAPPAVADT